ncbi:MULTISPECIES: hypothetical protein [Undibacterium]|jgi:hypothetical protein|uniref:Uncharacterized protein n=1 Tax=Undibacterium umbellatum TaxID=2762300 RepID=A0ABR6ZEQ6_9BURK|nr:MULTISPECIES: hypothetical protein [Undibacterium]MBC3910221.1 hypothetical protein [Undibacterium umbellatum]MDP1978478.1 hypothetical protein [Undibacterium sp.]
MWLIIISASALMGFAVARFYRGNFPAVLAAFLPWTSLLAWLLFSEYVLPVQSGGASMWPVAQLFGGSVAALTGWTTFRIFRKKSWPD